MTHTRPNSSLQIIPSDLANLAVTKTSPSPLLLSLHRPVVPLATFGTLLVRPPALRFTVYTHSFSPRGGPYSRLASPYFLYYELLLGTTIGYRASKVLDIWYTVYGTVIRGADFKGKERIDHRFETDWPLSGTSVTSVQVIDRRQGVCTILWSL